MWGEISEAERSRSISRLAISSTFIGWGGETRRVIFQQENLWRRIQHLLVNTLITILVSCNFGYWIESYELYKILNCAWQLANVLTSKIYALFLPLLAISSSNDHWSCFWSIIFFLALNSKSKEVIDEARLRWKLPKNANLVRTTRREGIN
jgi:hypothetical protein